MVASSVVRTGLVPLSIDEIMAQSWGGRGSGDGTEEDPLTGATPYADAVRVPFPRWTWDPAVAGQGATGTGVNRYWNPVAGDDAWDGSSPTFVSGTTGPKLTFGALYALANTGDATNMDCLNHVGGVDAVEGERGSGAKNVIIQAYKGAVAVLDPRETLGPWTPVAVGAQTTYRAAHACAHTAAENQGQADRGNLSNEFNDTDAFVVPSPDSVLGYAITRDGTCIRPATSVAVTSITLAGTTATVTTPSAHGLATGDTVTIHNARVTSGNYADYNGDFSVTVTGTNTFTYQTTAGMDTPVAAGEPTWGVRYSSYRMAVGGPVYYHDRLHGYLFYGEDPTTQVIKASTKRFLWTFSGKVIIRGLIMTCYAHRYGDSANDSTLTLSGAGSEVYNCAFGFGDGDAIGAAGSTARTFHHNGFFWIRGGVTGGGVANVRVFDNIGLYLNWPTLFGSKLGWHGGLAKFITSTNNNVVTRNHARYCNASPGWCDFATTSNLITNNLWEYCTVFGVSLEVNSPTVGSEAIVAGNVIRHAFWGIGTSGTHDAMLVHNGIWCPGIGLRVWDDRSPGNVHDIVVSANVLEGALGSDLPGMSIQGLVSAKDVGVAQSGASYFSSFDRNAMRWPDDVDAASDYSFARWADAAGAEASLSYAAWRTASGLEANGVFSNRHTYFVDPANGDCRVTGHVGAGPLLTAAQLAALGPAYGLGTAVAPIKGPRLYPGARPPGFAFLHTFTGADSATVTGLADTGQALVQQNGVWGISGNKLYASSDANLNLVTADAGVRNGWAGALVEGTLNSGSTFRSPGLVIKGVDASNYLFLELWNGQVFLYKVTAGVLAEVGGSAHAATTTTNATQYDLKVKFERDVVLAYQDGVLLLTKTLTSAEWLVFGNGTLVGCHWHKNNSGASAAWMDNLWVRPL